MHLSRPYLPSPNSPKTPADEGWGAAVCCCCSGRSASPCARCLCRELSLSLLLLMLLADDAAAAAAVSGIMLLPFQRGMETETERSVCGYTLAGLNEGEGEVKVVVSHPVCGGMRGETDCGVSRSTMVEEGQRSNSICGEDIIHRLSRSVCLCFQTLRPRYSPLTLPPSHWRALAGWPQHECILMYRSVH